MVCLGFEPVAAVDQYDQMTRLFVKYFAIHNNGNLPKSITNFSK